jgi:hypothetical protein
MDMLEFVITAAGGRCIRSDPENFKTMQANGAITHQV